MTFNNALNAVKQSLKRYLDQKQDRENEQTTVQAIREGIEFKGSNIDFCHFYGIIRAEHKFYCRHYRGHAYISIDGPYYGNRIGPWYQ